LARSATPEAIGASADIVEVSVVSVLEARGPDSGLREALQEYVDSVYANPAIITYLRRVRFVGTSHVNRHNLPIVAGHRE
jgi:hypothetical protein